jgi:hypothetical protein
VVVGVYQESHKNLVMTKIAIAPGIPALPLLVASKRKRPDLALGLLPTQAVVTPGEKVYTTMDESAANKCSCRKLSAAFRSDLTETLALI